MRNGAAASGGWSYRAVPIAASAGKSRGSVGAARRSSPHRQPVSRTSGRIFRRLMSHCQSRESHRLFHRRDEGSSLRAGVAVPRRDDDASTPMSSAIFCHFDGHSLFISAPRAI